MKKFLVIMLALTFLLGTAAVVFASGYTAPTGGSSPHGGFAASTALCKVCHAVHGATGTYKLLRNNSAATACDACHGSGGLADTDVYTDPDATSEHTIGAASVPDAGSNAGITGGPTSNLDCMDCHTGAPHGDNDGDVNKLTDYAAAVSNNNFCTSCHDDNASGSDTHPLATTGYTAEAEAWQDADTCRKCHQGTVAAPDKFPHRGDGLNFLRNDYTNAASAVYKLDYVCRECHTQTDLFEGEGGTTGVGITF